MTKFIKSSTNPNNYYIHNKKEVCFIGRSNVGKSTLLNKIIGSRIARTSKTPGRTRLINFFEYNQNIFVDLPGYGFAKTNKKEYNEMNKFVEEYFLERKNLIKTFVLIDSRRGPTLLDVSMINFLKKNNLSFYIFCTKSDKAKQSEKHRTIKMMREYTSDFMFLSSVKGIKIDDARKIIINCFE